MTYLGIIVLSLIIVAPWIGIAVLANGLSQAFGMIEDLYRRMHEAERSELLPDETQEATT